MGELVVCFLLSLLIVAGVVVAAFWFTALGINFYLGGALCAAAVVFGIPAAITAWDWLVNP